MGALYAGALRRGDLLEAVYPDGRRETVPVDTWRGPLLPADESVLARCTGPTLDVGCGPGRMAAALRARGVHALGIDTDVDAHAEPCSFGLHLRKTFIDVGFFHLKIRDPVPQ